MHCPGCGTEKEPEEFRRDRDAPSGRAAQCKTCHRRRLNLMSPGERSRHYHLRQRYAIGIPEVDAILTEQGMLCPICLKRPAEHVDHDHKTGKVRGILCEPCNGGLGQFKDNIQTIRNAIEYIERSRKDA